MAGPAEIIRSILVTQKLVAMPPVAGKTVPFQQLPGDGTTLCFIGSMPDTPDQAVAIYDTPGIIWGRRQRDAKDLVHSGILIKIRTLDYSGYDLANNLANSLVTIKQTNTIIGETTYYVASVYRTSNVVSLGEQVGKKRQQWTVQARVAFQDIQAPIG
jgi:ribosome biogenesis GTPase A